MSLYIASCRNYVLYKVTTKLHAYIKSGEFHGTCIGPNKARQNRKLISHQLYTLCVIFGRSLFISNNIALARARAVPK